MEKLKLAFASVLGLGIAGGFGHHVYYQTKAAADPGLVVQKAIETWCSNPYSFGAIALFVGYLIGHAGHGSK